MKSTENIKGLATGTGSLPHQDAQEALDLIFKYVPQAPFWPQLPKRSRREGMIAQFSENIPCLKAADTGVSFKSEGREEALEKFYEKILAADLDYFKISDDFASGLSAFQRRLSAIDLKDIRFIKLQITGPFTFAAGINDEKGAAILHDKVMMQAILQALKMKALWQAKAFSKFGKEMLMFIDEPYLGCFGSAYTPLNRVDVVGLLNEFSEGLSSDNLTLGVHCCGNTDWSIFTEVKGIGVINFDAFDYQDKFVLYAADIQRFLARGGVICWGIIPTQGFTGGEKAQFLAEKVNSGIDALAKRGVGRDLLSERLIISPACGLGTFSPQKAEEILRLLSETSGFIRSSL
jgi:methionine synthase II (cobalamin-independent)